MLDMGVGADGAVAVWLPWRTASIGSILLPLLPLLLLMAGGVRMVAACNFDYDRIHCKQDGDLDLTCTGDYAIRILSARKRKLLSGSCTSSQGDIYQACYSESTAYSSVTRACNTKTTCRTDVTAILSYSNVGCEGYNGDYILHVIYRCEPPSLPAHVAWTKSICSGQADPLPWAHIHSLVPNGASAFLATTSCMCLIDVPANVEVQIQPQTFSLTKYGTWCGQKIVLRDGADSREFCSQLYDPFILRCAPQARTLELSFVNNDASILTHFNISIWATTGDQLMFWCGLPPTTSTTASTVTSSTQTRSTSTTSMSSTTTTAPTTKPTPTTTASTLPTTTTTSTVPTTSSTISQTVTTRTSTLQTVPSSTNSSPTGSEAPLMTPPVLNVPSNEPPGDTDTSTTVKTTATMPPLPPLHAASTTSTTAPDVETQPTAMMPVSVSSSKDPRDSNVLEPAAGDPKDQGSQEPSFTASRIPDVLIIGAVVGGLIFVILVVTGAAFFCARRKSKPDASSYPTDTMSEDHIYEEPTYYTMPYDPEPATLGPRTDTRRGPMTVGDRSAPSYGPQPVAVAVIDDVAHNPLYRGEHNMLFAY